MANNEIGIRNLNKSNRDSAIKALIDIKRKLSTMHVELTKDIIHGKMVIREKYTK